MRSLTRQASALLIFDEVLTGYRIGPGGAQQLFDIDPDLTVMAKALGAGYPVAALGGRRAVMELAADGRTMHGGTYNSNLVACAAVIVPAATIASSFAFFAATIASTRPLTDLPCAVATWARLLPLASCAFSAAGERSR